MNMEAGLSSAQCPSCQRSIGRWIEPRITHICASCGTPLVRFRASRKIRLYRIIPISKLARVTGSVITIAAIVSAIAVPGAIRISVFLVAVALLAFGAADLIQAGFRLRASRNAQDIVQKAPRKRVWVHAVQLGVGVACFLLGLAGLVIWAGITTEI